MKLGILTYHRACNFGANLQAYASSQFFLSLGYEVKVIDYIRKGDLSYSNTVQPEQYTCHQNFVELRLPLTQKVTTEEELKEVVKIEGIEILVIGADAVWSGTPNYRVYYGSWLFEDPELMSKIRVIALSPAIMGGNLNNLSYESKLEIGKDLRSFSKISVRDEWTKKIINNEIFNGDEFVKCVNPDPVFLVDSFIDETSWIDQGLEKGKYFVMTLPKGWKQSRHLAKQNIKWFIDFKKEVNHRGYQLVELPLPEGSTGLPFDKVYQLPYDAIQWYLTLKNSRAYCGLRFHAIVSCITAGVPFYSIDSYCRRPGWMFLLDVIQMKNFVNKYDRSSKIYNLLQGTGLEKYRNGGFVEFESAQKIVSSLISLDRNVVIEIAKKKQQTFNSNIRWMFE